MPNILFIIYTVALIYVAYQLGKDRGTYLASERAVDIMIAMGYLKENAKGQIEKVHNEQPK